MTIDRTSIIRIISAAHLDLVRADVTAEELTAVAVACADAIIGEPDQEVGLRVGATVRIAGASLLVANVLGLVTTDGELHTVRVRWPDGSVTLHQPRELEVVA